MSRNYIEVAQAKALRAIDGARGARSALPRKVMTINRLKPRHFDIEFNAGDTARHGSR
jgi:hypothetical protein